MKIEKSVINNLNKWHDEILGFGAQAFERAMKSGETLTRIKKSLKHGQWESWIKNNLHYDERTERRYRDIYKYRERLKSDTVSDLTTAYRLIKNLRDYDRIAKDWDIKGKLKSKIREKITANTKDVAQTTQIHLPPKKRKEREQSAEDYRYKRTIDSQLEYARQYIARASSNIENVYRTLKQINAEIVDLPAGFDQFDFYLPVKLHRAVKDFNQNYDKLYRQYSNPDDEEDQPRKTVESIEVQFPRNELPAPAVKVG